MSDHEDLADKRDAEADELEDDAERLAEHAEEAREAQQRAESDALVPEAMGQEDPGRDD